LKCFFDLFLLGVLINGKMVFIPCLEIIFEQKLFVIDLWVTWKSSSKREFQVLFKIKSFRWKSSKFSDYALNFFEFNFSFWFFSVKNNK